MIAVPMVLVAVSTIGFSLVTYSRLVLLDSAIEGARFAALADQDDESGCTKARSMATRALGANVTIRATCFRLEDSIGQLSTVSLSTNLLGIGLIPFGNELTVNAKAFSEIQR